MNRLWHILIHMNMASSHSVTRFYWSFRIVSDEHKQKYKLIYIDTEELLCERYFREISFHSFATSSEVIFFFLGGKTIINDIPGPISFWYPKFQINYSIR